MNHPPGVSCVATLKGNLLLLVDLCDDLATALSYLLNRRERRGVELERKYVIEKRLQGVAHKLLNADKSIVKYLPAFG